MTPSASNLCPNCQKPTSPRAIYCSTKCRMAVAYRRRREAQRLGEAIQQPSLIEIASAIRNFKKP